MNRIASIAGHVLLWAILILPALLFSLIDLSFYLSSQLIVNEIAAGVFFLSPVFVYPIVISRYGFTRWKLHLGYASLIFVALPLYMIITGATFPEAASDPCNLSFTDALSTALGGLFVLPYAFLLLGIFTRYLPKSIGKPAGSRALWLLGVSLVLGFALFFVLMAFAGPLAQGCQPE